MLDSLHHQGLRLTLGAFRTFPVPGFYVEADELKYNYTNYTHIYTDGSFRRIALWVAMETMHLNIARISLFMGTFFFFFFLGGGACMGSQ